MYTIRRFAKVLLVPALLIATTQRTLAQDIDITALENEAVSRLSDYLQIDTINPPGNESSAVDFFAKIFEAEGIPYETAESAPGRGNIWARLKGGPEPGFILLNHTDVVPADEEFWSDPLLSGDIKDGYLHGRGALDMKGTGIMQLQAFLGLHRMGKPLNRDVIFMATADEEAGGMFGAGWLAVNRPELFENVGFLLNEGGGGSIEDGKVIFGVEVTQKVPFWIRLVAKGQPGHGSSPRANSAVTRLVQALTRIHENPFPADINPTVDAYFKALAPHVPQPWQNSYKDIRTAVQDPQFLEKLQNYDRGLHSLVRNTCSITRIEGSSKINVIPPSATAELDCRLVPHQDPQEFLEALERIIDDPMVETETIMVFTPAVSSTDTDLYKVIENMCKRNFPDAPVMPSVSTGFTDSHFFRDMGIICYGFSPAVNRVEDFSGVHGNNEKISVESIKLGTRLTLEILQDFVITMN